MTTAPEGQYLDRKSLRKVTGSTADFSELAQDCVCFANSAGGQLLIGIEDGQTAPPPEQRIEAHLLDRISKRIGELTVNVQVLVELVQSPQGGEYITLTVPRSLGVASTSDGRYFVRIGDTCRPIVGDDVLRLADERPTTPWESMLTNVDETTSDPQQISRLVAALGASDRVKASVKEKTVNEQLAHYGLVKNRKLTNLGVLLIGKAEDRANLGVAPIVQAIRYDERGSKIGKYVWDDHHLSPIELVDDIWNAIPDFRESYEISDGMYRTLVPAFDEAVVREVLVNALVHRPYTHRGDIYLNLHPDRLEIVNPGRLPLGVTPRNILHASRRRNERLAQLFHDIKLMEREGSGFDLLYERLLVSGRPAPVASEGTDSVHVLVPRRTVQGPVIRLLAKVDQEHNLTQRERIVLAIIAQHSRAGGISPDKMCEILELQNEQALDAWTVHLLTLDLVHKVEEREATRYMISPALARTSGFDRWAW